MPDGGPILCRCAVAPHGSGMSVALLPADPQAGAALAKIAFGDKVRIKILRNRSLPHHRLFWAILQHVAESSRWETADRLLIAVKIRLGFYDLCALPSGKAVPVPKSISFAELDQDGFTDFFRRAIDVICAEVLNGHNPDDLIAEVCTATGLPRPALPSAAEESIQPVSAERVDRQSVDQAPTPPESESQKHIVAEQDQPQSAAVRRADGTQTASPPAVAPSDQNGATVAQSSGQTSGADQSGDPAKMPEPGDG